MGLEMGTRQKTRTLMMMKVEKDEMDWEPAPISRSKEWRRDEEMQEFEGKDGQDREDEDASDETEWGERPVGWDAMGGRVCYRTNCK